MTSQIILLNRYGAAVASDSIATIIDNDGDYLATVRNSEKVFALPGKHKVVLLNSDDGSISGAPIGVVLSLWMNGLPDEPLPTLWDYLEKFLNFLEDSSPDTYPDWANRFRMFIYDQLRPISEYMAATFPNYRPFAEETLHLVSIDPDFAKAYKNKLAKRVNLFLKQLETQRAQRYVDDEVPIEIQENRQIEVCTARDSDAIVDLWFPDAVIPKATKKRLKASIYKLINRAPIEQWGNLCRIAFVGFGSTEHYAKVFELGVENKFMSVVRWRGLGSADLSEKRSEIYYMAQTSAIRNFIYGVHPNFLEDLKRTVPLALVDDRRSDFEDPNQMAEDEVAIWRDIGASVHHKLETYIGEFQQKNEADLKTRLDFMETGELAAIAQSLLNLEILSAENKSGPSTVGGQTYVATIDISNGVKWISGPHLN